MHTYLPEIIMLFCFGFSWPISIAKSIRTKTVKGKSPIFLLLVIVGYAAGIVHKILNPVANPTGLAEYVVWFYAMNLLMVAVDLGLYFRYNRAESDQHQNRAR